MVRAKNGMMTPKEFAARVGVSERTLYRWIRSGFLEPIRFGAKGNPRFDHEHERKVMGK